MQKYKYTWGEALIINDLCLCGSQTVLIKQYSVYTCTRYNNSLSCVYIINDNTWRVDLEAAWHVTARWNTHTAWPSFTWHQFMKSFPNIKHSFPCLCCNKCKRRHDWTLFQRPPKDSFIASFWPTFNSEQVIFPGKPSS